MANPITAKCCRMCGAKPGKPHHAQEAHGQVVTLHRLGTPVRQTKASSPGMFPEIVCMFCRAGIYAIRRVASQNFVVVFREVNIIEKCVSARTAKEAAVWAEKHRYDEGFFEDADETTLGTDGPEKVLGVGGELLWTAPEVPSHA